MKNIKVGDWVKHKKMNLIGKISKIIRRNVIIEHESNSIKVPIEDVEITNNNTIDSNISFSYKIKTKIQCFNPEIDLHGLSVEDALTVTDKFIDEAIVSGHRSLKIIHGKGTGKLKSSLLVYLKKDKRVAKIITNHILSGGVGVTMIEL